MTKLTALSCISVCVLAGSVAVACGDDSKGSSPDGASGSGNEAGTTAGGSGSNSGGSSNPGTAGVGGDDGVGGETPGGGGVPGGAGEGGSGEGGAGGSPDPAAGYSCDDFPLSLTLGSTIGATQSGAVVCLDTCRITTNTYSDGDGACANADTGIAFFADSSNGGSYRAYLQSTWSFVSATAGTINQEFAYSLEGIPSGTEVTVVIAATGNVEYTVVFEFEGGTAFTITSFTEN